MNQILVTQKLYVTPELRRKKKVYKITLFLSVFLLCLFSTYYIYAEYDRNKSEEVSQEILSDIRFEETVENKNDDTTIKKKDNVIVVAIMDEEIPESTITETNSIITETATQTNTTTNQENKQNNMELVGGYVTTSDGKRVYTEAILNIPRLEINYPVLSETSEELLKISINKFWGPNGVNEVGNYCIVGHNYKNKKMFGKLSEMVDGDIIELTDGSGRTLKYSVYDRYIVDPTDVSCTSQLTNGRKDVTLITCTNYGKQRLVIKAKEIK